MVESLLQHSAALHVAASHLWVLALVSVAAVVAATVACPAGAGAFGPSPQAGADGVRYSWAVGYQSYSRREHVTGLWATLQNERPSVDDADGVNSAHSLGQLWAIEYRGPCMSDVEMGWTVSPGQYGDAEPHLFVYAWDCGVGLGYVGQSSIPWVQVNATIAPNATLSPGGELHLYGVALRRGDWWFSYDGQWIGYIPASAWTRMFPATIGEALVGGEVVTAESEPCTAMGNEGLYGSSGGAALVADVWYQGRQVRHRRGGTASRLRKAKTEARLTRYESDPSYTTGGWDRGRPGPRFRYGGPGACG
jgi:Neprosin